GPERVDVGLARREEGDVRAVPRRGGAPVERRLDPELRILLAVRDGTRMFEHATGSERGEHAIVESERTLEVVRSDRKVGEDAGVVVGHGVRGLRTGFSDAWGARRRRSYRPGPAIV